VCTPDCSGVLPENLAVGGLESGLERREIFVCAAHDGAHTTVAVPLSRALSKDCTAGRTGIYPADRLLGTPQGNGNTMIQVPSIRTPYLHG
jgi:hypothetical protein